ncbi:MAG: HAD-IA family hydrolase, partial [Prevotella sp.]|nr:HAD-IA family hydrolase [Prevotella sp.]
GVDDYFDACFLSYEMHLFKPDEEIFRQTLLEAGIEAGETLFVDDLPANCEAARALGIHVLHETTGTDWMSKIE